jgi:hypothetical protein
MNDGTYQFYVKAVDLAGNNGTFGFHDVYIDMTAPNLTVSTPANGSTVGGSVEVTVDTVDIGSGMDRVEFYIDGDLKYTSTLSPYIWDWDASLVADGKHTIRVISYDKVNNSVLVDIEIMVDNTSIPEFTGPIALLLTCIALMAVTRKKKYLRFS